MMELGLYTFGDLPIGVRSADAAQQRLAEIVSAAKLADEAGLSPELLEQRQSACRA